MGPAGSAAGFSKLAGGMGGVVSEMAWEAYQADRVVPSIRNEKHFAVGADTNRAWRVELDTHAFAFPLVCGGACNHLPILVASGSSRARNCGYVSCPGFQLRRREKAALNVETWGKEVV